MEYLPAMCNETRQDYTYASELTVLSFLKRMHSELKAEEF